VLSTNCYFDAPQRTGSQNPTKNWQLSAGRFDGASGVSPRRVAVELSSRDEKVFQEIRGEARHPRPDVVKVFNAPGALDSGFDCSVDLSGLEAGEYH